MNLLKLRRIQAHLDYLDCHSRYVSRVNEMQVYQWIDKMRALTVLDIQQHNLNIHEISLTIFRLEDILPIFSGER